MTVTVAVEELREFERRCVKWHRDRSEFVGATISHRLAWRAEPGTGFGTPKVELVQESVTAGALTKDIAEWEKENPPPRLIPDV